MPPRRGRPLIGGWRGRGAGSECGCRLDAAAFSSTAAGSSAGDELPLLVSTTELRLRRHAARLLLQEHLQQVLAQRDGLAAMRRLLEQENEEYARDRGPAGAVSGRRPGPAGADEPLTRGPSSAETASAGVSPLLSPTAVRECREELKVNQCQSDAVGERGEASTPNLANLVSSLDQGAARQAADASGASALWGRPRSSTVRSRKLYSLARVNLHICITEVSYARRPPPSARPARASPCRGARARPRAWRWSRRRRSWSPRWSTRGGWPRGRSTLAAITGRSTRRRLHVARRAARSRDARGADGDGRHRRPQSLRNSQLEGVPVVLLGREGQQRARTADASPSSTAGSARKYPGVPGDIPPPECGW